MAFTAKFQFVGSLRAFPGISKKGDRIPYIFNETPSVKDAIEAIGVPHPEVAAISINGRAVSFQERIHNLDEIVVFPKELAYIWPKSAWLLPSNLTSVKFIADVHLGKLARLLRLLGFDTLYRNCLDDKMIAAYSNEEKRIVLTRDVGLLKQRIITLGYWLRSQDPVEQTREVIRYYGLEHAFHPFSRCMKCNGPIVQPDKALVIDRLPDLVKKCQSEFYQCIHCRQIYWKGSHYDRMIHQIQAISSGIK
jgi:uncharacterized protein